MDKLIGGLIILVSVGSLGFGIYLFGMLLHPIFLSINGSLKTGKWPSKEENKLVVMGLLMGAGQILIVPTVLLTVFLIALQVNVPIMNEIGQEINYILVDVINEFSTDDYVVDYDTNDVTQDSGGYAPPEATPHYAPQPLPAVQPTLAPVVIVVTATPVVDLNPSVHWTPTPAPTLP